MFPLQILTMHLVSGAGRMKANTQRPAAIFSDLFFVQMATTFIGQQIARYLNCKLLPDIHNYVVICL